MHNRAIHFEHLRAEAEKLGLVDGLNSDECVFDMIKHALNVMPQDESVLMAKQSSSDLEGLTGHGYEKPSKLA